MTTAARLSVLLLPLLYIHVYHSAHRKYYLVLLSPVRIPPQTIAMHVSILSSIKCHPDFLASFHPLSNHTMIHGKLLDSDFNVSLEADRGSRSTHSRSPWIGCICGSEEQTVEPNSRSNLSRSCKYGHVAG